MYVNKDVCSLTKKRASNGFEGTLTNIYVHSQQS